MSKVIAKKLERVLKRFINPDQTGFIKGRYIGRNIRLINDITEQTKTQTIPSRLLQLAFKKALDTTEWEFTQKALALFHFWDNIQQWISTLYTNPESSVMSNDFCTNPFPTVNRCETRLSPVSLSIYSACEILTCKIKLKQRKCKVYRFFFKKKNLQ